MSYNHLNFEDRTALMLESRKEGFSPRKFAELIKRYPRCLVHVGRGQISNSKLPEELRLKCLNIVSDQLHGFGPTLAYEKLTTVHGFDLSVETLRSWMIAAD